MVLWTPSLVLAHASLCGFDGGTENVTRERLRTRTSSLTTTGAQLPCFGQGLPHCPASAMYNLMGFISKGVSWVT